MIISAFTKFRTSKPTQIPGLCFRTFNTSPQNNFHVAVLGASGGIGQPLGMLLKVNRLISKLTLYDLQHTMGVAADLSHIETPAKVKGFVGKDKLCEAIECANIVVIPAGLPRKPGMTRDDLFNKNASVVRDLVACVADTAPKALIGIITNPINAVIPIACEVLKKKCKLDPRRVFGITTLDIVRANTFVASLSGVSPLEVNVPVIGGHSPETIIPVFSRATPGVKVSEDKVKTLTKRIKEAGTEVVKAKAGTGSATLSMAYAAARFTNSLLRGLAGEKNVVESSYVQSDVVCDISYFATPLVLGKNGIEKNLGVGKLNKFEEDLVRKALPVLKKNIATGCKSESRYWFRHTFNGLRCRKIYKFPS
ncbi:unnamed protein product [Psylliodes chrysocephalus]|uniref:Malate dehydrogenase n=1 Tax=Psylliodes chrysocephalus TaxID=3402493 RepID=A0A9P0D6T6_9CUCU|nr:unnamed protein product [Psylliodes chrysocephala]